MDIMFYKSDFNKSKYSISKNVIGSLNIVKHLAYEIWAFV